MKPFCKVATLFPLLLLSVLLTTFSACKTDSKAKVISESAREYVYAYTSGRISIAQPVRVSFADPVVGPEEVGEQTSSNLLRLRPQVAGTTRWEDERTLIFEPDQWLDSKTSYVATVQLSELFPNAPEDARSFEFGFQTREQHLEVYVDGLEAAAGNDLRQQQLRGAVYTADVVKAEALEKSVRAVQTGNALPLEWVHDTDQMKHQFVVKNVVRGEESGVVELNWNGNLLGLSESNRKTVEVPSLGEFKVMDARIVQEQEQYILVQFSDPLQSNQDLTGMVRIDDYSGQLRYTVDGNQLRVYPAGRINGQRRVNIQGGIRNVLKAKMKNPSIWDLAFEELAPQVRLVGTGVILPQSEGLIFPFEAVNLQAIDVEVFKIYHNNILQFLQSNYLSSNSNPYELERVGRVVLQKKINLRSLNAGAQARNGTSNWSRYAIDLGQMIEQDPHAVYQVRIGFRPEYSTYTCNTAMAVTASNREASPYTEEGEIRSIWRDDYYGIGGYYDDFTWEHREDPCFPAYFNTEHFVRRNVVASNFGIVSKLGKDGTVFTAVSDLLSTEPQPGVTLDFYDFQQQLIAQRSTDGDGIYRGKLDRKPFVVVASKDGQKGYLRMMDPNALSLSKFDVGGSVVQKGLKGFLYGERGVWRPGDTLFLNFVLEDQAQKLPADYPLSFELYDARNQLQEQFTTSKNVNRIYPLQVTTEADDPTGNWRAVVKAGGATFSKTLKVETVKPNRLKVQLDFGGESLRNSNGSVAGDLQVNWLHGAPARNLKAVTEAVLKNQRTRFQKYGDYVFDDPARKYRGEAQTIFDGQVDDQGRARISASLVKNTRDLPGRMRVSFRTRAFENGGDFSEDNYSIDYDPFTAYAGVSIPKDQYRQKRLDIGEAQNIDFALVDVDGKPLANRGLEVGLYRVNWSWWWERDNSRISRYNSSTHLNALEKVSLRTNSRGLAQWPAKVERWGRYLIRVCDPETGHCSGDFFYAGYPWYDDDNGSGNREAASMLAFMSDKEKYQVGDEVTLTVPTSGVGQLLISIESGSKVLESYWRPAAEGDTKFTFTATEEMSPTVYAHVTLIQPHSQSENDLPIRMYGVIPIEVEDEKTRLSPQLKMADVLRPEEKVSIEVSEARGQPMAYTVAVVDDGLLDLTRFKTPDPWNSFYAREALGVQTWDVYNDVLGAYGGQLERLLSIGGDDAVAVEKGKNSANRFKPVVVHFGPFFLDKGEQAKHEFVMPNYVGSVRTMVVAANQGAYGNAEKTCPVRKPLMVLATLPRVLGPGEQLSLPVNVFAMEDKVKSVRVTVEETSGLVNFAGARERSLSFDRPGDQMVNFELSVTERIGVANFKITAQGNGERASQEVEILIRNPNPYTTDIVEGSIATQAEWDSQYQAIGVRGTNSTVLEVSTIPPLNLADRLRYLVRYPHGCIEQTTSAAFPQLYVGQLMELNEKQQNEIRYNISAAIDKLRNFQNNDGGFSYWPGEGSASDWGTNYAGHFLVEAKQSGYSVSSLLIDRWVTFQRNAARRWNRADEGTYGSQNSMVMQAYRLYTLALAGKADLGAMNRLREMNNLSANAAWRLAAAYSQIGKPEVAQNLIQNLDTRIPDYVELSYTYGSGLRDRAMVLETLTLMGEQSKAARVAKSIAEQLGARRWYGTQTVAYSLMAMAKFVGKEDRNNQLKFAYQMGSGQWTESSATTPMMQVELPEAGGASKVKNQSGGTLFCRLISRGQPLVGDQTATANDLKIAVRYRNLNGSDLDPSQITQGTDFIAEVKVTNPGTRQRYYREMALAQVFPSGWEILNTRMSDVQRFQDSSRPTYQDIRDDRVYSYFNIGSRKSQTYRVQLNAAYQGRYYLPSLSCEAMYDHTISAREPGQWVEVVRPSDL